VSDVAALLLACGEDRQRQLRQPRRRCLGQRKKLVDVDFKEKGTDVRLAVLSSALQV
jgi:hypothetical protein